MSPEEFEIAMKQIYIKTSGDTEIVHTEMDNLMCELLKSLGYNAGVKIFNDSDKWYG